MVQVVLEIFHRTYLWQNLLDDVLMIAQDVVKFVCLEVVARLQVDELAEREAAQVIAFHDAVQLRVLFLQSHHA